MVYDVVKRRARNEKARWWKLCKERDEEGNEGNLMTQRVMNDLNFQVSEEENTEEKETNNNRKEM